MVLVITWVVVAVVSVLCYRRGRIPGWEGGLMVCRLSCWESRGDSILTCKPWVWAIAGRLWGCSETLLRGRGEGAEGLAPSAVPPGLEPL